jgi:hypothetical protein
MAPLLARGYVLTYDMVFVPRLELTRNLLGLDTAVARAVPGDLLVALASRLVPADLVQKLILLGILVAAGTGAARLTPTNRPAAKAATAALYAWNPFVYERLIMGHWGLLVAYATLPFVARAATDLRLGARGSVRRLILTLAVAAAASPPGGLIAAAVALCVAAAPGRPPAGTGNGHGGTAQGVVGSQEVVGSQGVVDRQGGVDSGENSNSRSATLPLRGPARRAAALRAAWERYGAASGAALGQRGAASGAAWAQRGAASTADRGSEFSPLSTTPPARGSGSGGAVSIAARVGVVGGFSVVVNAPWLVPSVLRPGGVPVRAEGAAAFASRPDGPLGTVGSLVGLGGIWSSLAVPPGVGSWAWLGGFVVVLAVVVAGLPLLWRRLPAGAATGLLVAAGLGLVLAAAYAVPGLRSLVDLAVVHVPGGGLIRDAQKFVAPLALVEAVAFGLGVERLAPALPPRWGRAAAVGLVAAPVLLLPALAWGAAGRLAAVSYPEAFAEARTAMAADPVPGALLVLPWHLYAGFPWNGGRVVLDPAQRWFTRRAVGNDDLELAGATVPGEDPYGARLGPLVTGSAPLAPALPAHGIRYVLVFKVAEWTTYGPRLSGLDPVLDRRDLALYRVPARPVEVRLPAPPATPVLVADLLAAGLIIGAAIGFPSRRVRQLLFSGRYHQGGRR